MKGRSYLLVLSLLAGALLSLSWFSGLTILVFFGFVPLLMIEHKISSDATRVRKTGPMLLYFYIAFLFWNVAVTWWVVFASAGGAVLAFVFNSLFMAMVLVIWSAVRSFFPARWSVWLLIPVWVTWEHIHTLWDISWTWLTLGNVFAFRSSWVQWYEFTGTSGGTAWILLVNILVFRALSKPPAFTFSPRTFAIPLLAIVVPIVLSFFIGREERIASFRTDKKIRVVVAQPNIDPYNEKFYFDYQSQFLKALRLIRGKVDAETDYLVLPETFITGISWYGIDEHRLNQAEELGWFRDSVISRFPNIRIVVGGNTYRFYPDKESASLTARRDKQSGRYFDVFNTAIYIDAKQGDVYHKSKLVPGVEKMPFPALLSPLEGLAVDLGGTAGSLGMQEERTVFTDSHDLTIAPVICYESIYSDYVSQYMRKGADVIFIITNDGWWRDTPGYIQHLHYGALRAIESRKPIARSANTGISCFVDERGVISQQTQWWKEAVITADLPVNNKVTFFTKYGDLLSRISVGLTLLLLAAAVFLRLTGRRVQRQEPSGKKP